MGLQTIGIRPFGIKRPVGSVSSQSWSSYWITRFASGIAAVTYSVSQINVSWTNNGSGWDNILIYATTNPDGVTDRVLLATLASNATSYSHEGLTRNYYYYSLRYVKGSNYSPYTTPVYNDIPTILFDGNTIWYDASDLASITKNAGNEVSQWNDKYGWNAKSPLKQVTATKLPIWSADGITGDGSNDFMSTTGGDTNGEFTLAQPIAVYFVVKAPTWQDAKSFMDGRVTSSVRYVLFNFYPSSQNKVSIFAFAYLSDKTFTPNVWHSVRIFFKGATSRFTIDDAIYLRGNAGGNWMNGITLWSLKNGTGNVNATFKDAIFRGVEEIEYNASVINNYLKRKNNLSFLSNDYLQTSTENFLAARFGSFICWSFATFAGDDFIGPDQDPNIFNPTSTNAQAMVDDWLDTCVAAGMKYAVFDAKTNDGWCMWPTLFADFAHSPYSISQSAWYAANGSPDFVALFVAGCNSRGLLPILYFSILDTTHEARTGTDETTDAAAYISMIETQLTELLTNYGTIAGIWLDGYAWHITYNYIPYSVAYNKIRSIQPACLVMNNEHDLVPPNNSDIFLNELVAGSDDPTVAGNRNPAEDLDCIRVDQKWNYNDADSQLASAFRDKTYINGMRTQCNSRAANYCITMTPDYSGFIPPAQKAILESLEI